MATVPAAGADASRASSPCPPLYGASCARCSSSPRCVALRCAFRTQTRIQSPGSGVPIPPRSLHGNPGIPGQRSRSDVGVNRDDFRTAVIVVSAEKSSRATAGDNGRRRKPERGRVRGADERAPLGQRLSVLGFPTQTGRRKGRSYAHKKNGRRISLGSSFARPLWGVSSTG